MKTDICSYEMTVVGTMSGACPVSTVSLISTLSYAKAWIQHQSMLPERDVTYSELGDLITDKQTRIDTNAARITELGALITDKRSRIVNNAARITELEALIVDKQSRIAALNPDTRAERIAELEALIIAHQERIEFLTTRNAELAALITAHETRITELTTRNAELAALITAHETRITELTNRNAELASLITGHEERSVFLTERNEVLTTQRETFQAELDALLATGCNEPPVTGSNVTYLHSDHLGRPKFATNANGDVVWDEGITTPFGIQITAMAAQTQALMFPGQYEDLETTGAGVTLSHNWHRTYDPTLGRYLQSDPIGLAGGLNRYAYVGGNPVIWLDPTGLNPGIDSRGNAGSELGRGVGVAWPIFSRNRRNMMNSNTIGADKFFHCLANCEAAELGSTGLCGADTISAIRELVDFPKNIFKEGLSVNQSLVDAREDFSANNFRA